MSIGTEEKIELETMEISLLGENYRVRCPIGEGKTLLRTAEILNGRLKQVRDTGKVQAPKHILVMVALNLCHELLNTNAKRTASLDNMTNRLHDIERRIEDALTQDVQEIK